MTRYAIPSVVLIALLTSPRAVSQADQVLPAPLPNSRFGAAIAGIGDLDGDGLADLAVGEPQYEVPFMSLDSGRVLLLSGADLSTIRVVDLANPGLNNYFGKSVAGLGDVSGDGVPDLAVGGDILEDGTSFAQAHVVSGADGSLLMTVGLTPTLITVFGSTLANAGDVDADGTADLLVGVRAFSGAGQAFVYSGATGAVLHALIGSSGGFGIAVAGVGDVNGDGHDDFAVGDPFAALIGGGSSAGLARVYSGADGSVLHSISGTAANDRAGESVAGVGDRDGDGVPDFAVGLPHIGSATPGEVRVISGATGATILTLVGAIGESFGSAIARAGDRDGDGVPDLAVGAPANAMAGSQAGRVALFSGADGALIEAATGTANSRLGAVLAPFADGDGTCVLGVAAGAPAVWELGGSAFVQTFAALPVSAYVGSREDFVLRTVTPGSCAAQGVQTGVGGNPYSVRLDSPAGGFVGAQLLLLGQPFATGTPPGSPFGFAALHVNPSVPGLTILFGTPLPGLPFSPFALTSAGLDLTFTLPLVSGPVSFLLQGLAISPLASNGFFAATHAHEIVFP